jgi:hypothetical protein
MCLKFRKEITNPFAPVNLIANDSRIVFKLFCMLPTSEEKFVVFWIFSFLLKFFGKTKFPTCCL